MLTSVASAIGRAPLSSADTSSAWGPYHLVRADDSNFRDTTPGTPNELRTFLAKMTSEINVVKMDIAGHGRFITFALCTCDLRHKFSLSRTPRLRGDTVTNH